MSFPILDYHVAMFSHPGKVREMNEDKVVDCTPQQLWALADGMGGYDGGALASLMVVESLHDMPPATSITERIEQVTKALNRVNHYLSQEKTLGQSQMIGSTICCFTSVGSACACLWAGDSRGYLFREGSLYPLTQDHHAQMPDGNYGLTQAIGMGKALSIEHHEFNLQIGDQLLLISDGVHHYLTDTQLQENMYQDTPQEIVSQISQQVLLDRAHDNFSIIIIKAILA